MKTHRLPKTKVSDTAIMSANMVGMDAFDDQKSVHDNPYKDRDLRNAWIEGYEQARRQKEKLQG